MHGILGRFIASLMERKSLFALITAGFLLSMGLLIYFEFQIHHTTDGVGSLDLQLFYNPKQLYATLSLYGSTGRQEYMLLLLGIGWIYPVFSALFFAALMTLLSQWLFVENSIMHRLNLLPLLALAVDYLENALLMLLLLIYPDSIAWLAGAAGLLTVTKWGLAIMVGALVSVSLVVYMVNRALAKVSTVML